MKARTKQFLEQYLWPLVASYKLILSPQSYLHSTGWIRSLKTGYPCDQDGRPVPWMNYTLLNLLTDRLNKDMRLFEFGSGYSTLFYARLVRDVISVEHDAAWLNALKRKLPSNVDLIHRQSDIDGAYCRAITDSSQQFDIVVIDGVDRVNCLRQSLDRLSTSGVIILDDSQRAKYHEAITLAKNKGFRALSIEGMKPNGFMIERTTIFYRAENCLNI